MNEVIIINDAHRDLIDLLLLISNCYSLHRAITVAINAVDEHYYSSAMTINLYFKIDGNYFYPVYVRSAIASFYWNYY
jgi:hypothetical protein